MSENKDIGEKCFRLGEKYYEKTFSIHGIDFVPLPLVKDKITSRVPAGEKITLLTCLYNTTDKDKNVGVKIEVPTKEKFKSTHLLVEPKQGTYWKVEVPSKQYNYIPFVIYTSEKTPKKSYDIYITVWPSKARTIARTAAAIAGGIFLGKIGSTIAKAGISDEKSIKVPIIVI